METITTNMDNIKFLPWVGSRYANGFNGITTLILGESHYQWNCGRDVNEWRTITQTLIQEQVDGHYTKAFWTKIAIAFLGHKPTQEEKRGFWSSVAFYNYVQESAGDGPRIAPNQSSWSSSEEAFMKTLQSLKPRFVLVLGDRLASNLSRFLASRDVDIHGVKRPFTYRVSMNDGSSCLAYPIIHPSRGFNGRNWHPHILEAMNACKTGDAGGVMG